jgi:hypothetical protein
MWMCIIAIAPEIGVGMAVRQYLEARGAQWLWGSTIVHAFYVYMGDGFTICKL